MKYPIEKLVKDYRENANTSLTKDMERYMKNQFQFLGLKSPQRRELNAAFLRENGKPNLNEITEITQLLWSLKEREYQYMAMDLLKRFKKKWNAEHIDLFEFLIENKSWWDTVDFVAAHLAGSYFEMYPEKLERYNRKWINHDNKWFRRSAILFQLKYKTKTNLKVLVDNIEQTCHEKEFFIEKAIGWILREYSKTDPKWVEKFINKTELRPLSVREGMKWIHTHA